MNLPAGRHSPIRIGALISGGGSNLQAVIDACASGRVRGTVTFVGTDNPEAAGLKRAERHKIPAFVVDYGAMARQYRKDPGSLVPPADADLKKIARKTGLLPADAPADRVRDFLIPRLAAEAALLKAMARLPFDLMILAGFMRTLTPYFIDRVNTDPGQPRIMNIHPALLPAFPGVDGYGDTFRYGCKIGGCTVHFVDYGEDTGPIIGQKAFEITDADTLETVRRRGLQLEWQLYPECIRLFAENRLKIVSMPVPKDGATAGQRPVVKRLSSRPQPPDPSGYRP